MKNKLLLLVFVGLIFGLAEAQTGASSSVGIRSKGDAGIEGNVGIVGNLTVTGDAGIGGNLGVNGTIIPNLVQVISDAGVRGNLGVLGTTTTGLLQVTSDAGVNGNLGVIGTSTTGLLQVTSDAGVNGNLGVIGTSTTGLLQVTSDAGVNGNLGVVGTTTTNLLGVTSDAGVGGNLGVIGTSTTGLLQVTSDAGVNGNLGVIGQVTVGTVPLVTLAAMQLYVDPLGSDANDCTSTGSSACLTIAGAYGKIPRIVRHPVDISVATGNYTGVYISGFTYDPASTAGAYINITGTLTESTLATGSATGTATAGTAASLPTTWATLTDSGAAWTVDDLAGRLLTISSGTGSGTVLPIVSNTATVITVAATPVTYASGSVYAIKDNTANINTRISMPAMPAQASLSNRALIGVATGTARQTVSTAGNLTFTNLKFSTTTGRSFELYGEAAVRINQCQFVSSSSNQTLQSDLGSTANITGTSFVSTNTAATALSAAGFGVITGTGAFILQNVVIKGYKIGANVTGFHTVQMAGTSIVTGSAASSIGVQIGGFGSANLQTNRFDCSSAATSTGVLLGSSAGQESVPLALIGSMNISNCVTGVYLSGARAKFTSVTTGTASTTGVSVNGGSWAQWLAANTLSGTTNDILIDGSSYTLAALRAMSPKRITDLSSLSTIFEP
jgi:hypothetical protein